MRKVDYLLFFLKKNGFFVEAGAFDGETASNTLLLERKYGWKGVLVEPSQESFIKILNKNRKAWFIPSCLSPYQYPIEVRNCSQYIDRTKTALLHNDIYNITI